MCRADSGAPPRTRLILRQNGGENAYMSINLPDLILSLTPEDGAPISNTRMLAHLREHIPDLSKEDYETTRDTLIDGRRLQRGRGYGGSIHRSIGSMNGMKGKLIRVNNVGPISDARIELGDLTILVGPQASGKSIFLQTLKLAMDRNHILGFFKQQNIDFKKDPRAMLNGYFGRGMADMLNRKPTVTWEGRTCGLESLARPKGLNDFNQDERLFYIPAQRVVSLPSGRSQNFGSFNFGDPYVLRYFGHQVHLMLQNEFISSPTIFPTSDRLNKILRDPIESNIFRSSEIVVDPEDFTRTFNLKVNGFSKGLPFLAWSAGQREFFPLLMGLYWLCPGRGAPRRDQIEWVVVEEPEMGLHPRAIETFLLLVLELMKREYKVLISTHSTVILDLVWAMNHIKNCTEGRERDVRSLFQLHSNQNSKEISRTALTKDYRVYVLERGATTTEITELDPGSTDPIIANWGNLSDFSGRVADVVAEVFARSDRGTSGK